MLLSTGWSHIAGKRQTTATRVKVNIPLREVMTVEVTAMETMRTGTSSF